VNGSHPRQERHQFVYSLVYGKRVWCTWLQELKLVIPKLVRASRPATACRWSFKGETGFSAEIYVKLFVGSNFAPVFTPNADLSRVMVCKVKPSQNTEDPGWESGSKPKLPPSSGRAGRSTRALCPKHARSASPTPARS